MSTIAATRSKTYDIVYIAVFAVIMAICSWISIPAAVPFTLQTFGVFVAVGVLGGKRGTLSILVFILLGAIGVPVFAGFSGGIGVLAGTTGGYIIGFLFSALVMWAMEKLPGKKSVMQIVSMIVGLIVCYAFGTAWFMIVYSRANGAVGLATVLGWCVIPFIIPDIIKIVLAYGLSRKLRKFRCDLLLKTAGIFFTIKALGTLLAPGIPVFYGVQIFQMLGWGLMTAASVYYVNALMEPEDAIKGQAYFTMAYTLGSVLGSFLGGTLIDLAGVHAMLFFSIVSAFIGALIVLIFAERTSK